MSASSSASLELTTKKSKRAPNNHTRKSNMMLKTSMMNLLLFSYVGNGAGAGVGTKAGASVGGNSGVTGVGVGSMTGAKGGSMTGDAGVGAVTGFGEGAMVGDGVGAVVGAGVRAVVGAGDGAIDMVGGNEMVGLFDGALLGLLVGVSTLTQFASSTSTAACACVMSPSATNKVGSIVPEKPLSVNTDSNSASKADFSLMVSVLP